MLIDLATARAHIRDDAAPDDQVLPYLRGAELSAEDFLNRRVFADQAALDSAIAGVPAALALASAARDAGVIAGNAIEDELARVVAIEHATAMYGAALYQAKEILCGMVVNEAVKAAILLVFGHLYANREDSVVGATVADLPMGSRYLLQPYRMGMGV